MIELRRGGGIRSQSVTVEVALWLFELGWLRVSYTSTDQSSLIATVVDPAGAGGIARVTLLCLAIAGCLSVVTRLSALRVAHMLLAAFWWTVVAVLTYQHTTAGHPGGWSWWLPTNTTAYSYAFIAALTVIWASRIIRSTRAPKDAA